MPDNLKYPLVDQTANFEFYAKASLGAAGAAIVASLKGSCEQDYTALRTTFGKGAPPGLPFRIVVDDTDNGADHGGCADVEIYVGQNKSLVEKFSAAKMNEVYRLLMVAEVVEVFESMTANWNCGYSPGEALSRTLALEAHPQGEFGSTAGTWLDSGRPDWVDQTDPDDTHSLPLGCSVLFLNWLRHVKGFTWQQIIAADRATLAGIYSQLTGKNDAWAAFSADMTARWPVGKPSQVTTDQPFP